MNKKVAIVFFGPISLSKQKLNLSSFNNEIVLKFYQSNSLERLYCLDFDGINIDKALIRSFSQSFLSKVAFLVSKVITKLNVGITERMIYEKFFEYYILLDIDFSDVETLLFLRSTSPQVCKVAKKKGKTLVGLIATYPRKFIRDRIQVHEDLWGIKEVSDYTIPRRVKDYDLIVSSWDKIICLTGSSSVKETLSRIGLSNVEYPKYEFGVDTNLFYPDEQKGKEVDSITFLVTTDPSLKKGLLVALSAWNKFVTDENRNVKLLIVGKIGSTVRKVVDSSFKLKNVEFLGYVNDLEEYYRKVDVYICPSIIDMGPRTIKQAMACGTAVVASDQCGAAAFVEPYKEGLIFDSDSSDDLLSCLNWISVNRTEIKKLGDAAYVKSRIFDNTKFAESVYEIALT